MPTPKVIDLSHHNTIPGDLMATAAAGIKAVIHKLTEGTTYVDNKVQARRFLADDAGLAWGVYHFLRPGNVKQQAKFFLDTGYALGVIDDNTALVADHEDEKVPAQDLKTFLDEVESITGRSPIVYSGHVLKDQLAGKGYRPKRRLWLCQYTSGTPSLPEGVDKYWLWQYTDKGSIPGVNSPVDLNTYDVSDAEFLAGWAGAEAPPPPPTPTKEVVVYLNVEATAPPGITVRVVVNQ